MQITKREDQIILGTILGGSSIVQPSKGKHCYLSMRGKHGIWLEYKALQLAKFASSAPFTKETTNRWHSLCLPIFDKYKQMFWKDGKRSLKLDFLEGFWDVGLAVWFGDCGKYQNGKVVLNTHIWGEKGSKIVADYFNLCQWPANVVKDRKYFRVKIDAEASVQYIKTIRPELPDAFFKTG
jgi:hypothetical protein